MHDGATTGIQYVSKSGIKSGRKIGFKSGIIKGIVNGIKPAMFIPVAMLFLISISSPAVSYGKPLENALNITLNTDLNTVIEKNNIFFENSYVEGGIPLKVSGAPKGASYHWTLTGADGSKETFITSDDTYTPSMNDLEKLITVSVNGREEDRAMIYYSRLPVLYIENEAGYYGVEDGYTGAALRMQGNPQFSDRDELYNGSIKIKLRGNSTRYREKRPFHMKLNQKADLLGMGRSKHWVLLANDIDHTLMRNKILYDFSGAIGMDTYMKSEFAVLIFNGAYYGVYQLCEQVDIGENRVEIYDWEETAEDVAEAITEGLYRDSRLTREEAERVTHDLEEAMQGDLSWITEPHTFYFDADLDGNTEVYDVTDYTELPEPVGGALLEMDFFAFDGHNPSTLITAYSQPIYFKTPKHAITGSTLFNNIYKGVQAFEYALHSTDFIYRDENIKYKAKNRYGGTMMTGYAGSTFRAPEYDGKHYSDLFDMDSLVQNFLVCEFSMNWDGMKNSVFFYKDINGLFHMGPAWDFDWAWGNINMYNINTRYPESWHTTIPEFTVEQYYQTVQWNRSLIRDPYFIIRAYEKYHEIRSTVIEDIIKEGGILDTYEDLLKEAAVANDAKWGYSYESYQSVGFPESLESMRSFILQRVKWLDQQFTAMDTLIRSLGYYTPSFDLHVVDVTSENGYTRITARTSNKNIKSISFQINGTNMITSEVIDNQAVCEIPDSKLYPDRDKQNVVQLLAGREPGKFIISNADEGNYYNAISNYAVFYSKASTDAAQEQQEEQQEELQEELQEEQQEEQQEELQEVSASEEVRKKAGKTNVVLMVILIIAGVCIATSIVFIIIRNRKIVDEDTPRE